MPYNFFLKCGLNYFLDEDEIKQYVKRFLSRNLEITSKTTI